jgi:RecA-family ATPase
MKAAGTEWFTKFLKRQKCLSLRKAEATSVSRASLKQVFDHLQIGPRDIWNMDETGIKTVQKPDSVDASRSFK